MKSVAFCGCGRVSVKTFEGQDHELAVISNKDSSAGIESAGAASSLSTALLLVFQHLPDRELQGVVTAVSKSWQCTAASALSSRLVTISGLLPRSPKAASIIAWLQHHNSHIQDLHIHHAEVSPEEWTAMLSMPFTNLCKLEINRSRVNSAELSLLTQMASLKELTLNSLGAQLEVSFVHQLGNSLTQLTKLELKSCGVGGAHLFGLTPFVQGKLESLILFDNPAIGADVDSTNKALQIWATESHDTPEGSQICAQHHQLQRRQHEAAAEAAPIAAAGTTVAVTLTVGPQETAYVTSPLTQQHAEYVSVSIKEVQVKQSTLAINSSKDACSSPTQQQQQQQTHRPRIAHLHHLQLSYCQIKHLPALAQLTSLTSLNLRENQCDAETVQAVGQLQQLQELVLGDAVGSGTPAEAYVALSALSILEELDVSGGPTGCLSMVLGVAPEASKAPPSSHTNAAAATAVAATAGHGLRVEPSGKSRSPSGRRAPVPEQSSCRGSDASSPGVPLSAGEGSLELLAGGHDSNCRAANGAALEPAGNAEAPATAAAAVAAEQDDDVGAAAPIGPVLTAPNELNLVHHKGPVVLVDLSTDNAANRTGLDGSCSAFNTQSSSLINAIQRMNSAAVATVTASVLPQLRRLEAEQLGLSDIDIAAIARCCGQLLELDISHNHIGPQGIANLSALTTLTHLNISGQLPALADTALLQLLQLRNLQGLDVGGNSFSAATEVQLQREGSAAGGHLTRLTGCGMRAEVHEPWAHVSLQRQQLQQQEKSSSSLDSTRPGRSSSLDVPRPAAGKVMSANGAKAARTKSVDSPGAASPRFIPG